MTAKEDGLWVPTSKVPAEDVRHLQHRVEVFRFTHVLRDVKDVESCAPCMARWITHCAAGHGAMPGVSRTPASST